MKALKRLFPGSPPKDDFWEERFNELAEYNMYKSKGLLFTEEKSKRMEQMQNDYNEKMKLKFPKELGCFRMEQ